MTQRLVAACVGSVLVVALAGITILGQLPYTLYSPGPTINVLGTDDGAVGTTGDSGQEIIQVGGGQKTYRDDGQLRMTTVSVTPRDARLNLFDAAAAWLDPNDAVYPHDAVYPDGSTAEDDKTEGQVQMVSSQDTATAVALRALGDDVPSLLEVQGIEKGSPADGALAVRDLIVGVNGTELPESGDLQKASDTLNQAIGQTTSGAKVELTVLRDGERVTVPVQPREVDGKPKIGIVYGEGFELPFPVTVNIDPRIGGPSAGLMFSLSIYDTLTPGSLTGGGRVAGTGEIYSDGKVGPIGGIQQKIAGSREQGMQLFLVPAANCDDAKGANNGDMRLARVATFDQAKQVLETWSKDHDAKLPSCS
jgi:Lon-like protease